jgi:hypothetical protein
MDRRDESNRRGFKEPHLPKAANDDEQLDEALKESFPASDPPAPAHPDVTGWDLEDHEDPRKKGPQDL